MAFSLGGLIGGVMKGTGEGYSKYAEVEMDKAAKIDYATRIMELQEEKDLRVDEIRRKRDITDIGLKADATAQAELRNAPLKGQAVAATKGGELDATAAAGIPEKQAALTKRTLEAEAPNVELKSSIEGKAEGTKQTAKTSVPGFLDSLAKEKVAGAAGERSVAAVTANAPKITPMGDGSYGVTVGGKLTSYLTDPKTGEKVMGPKDLDQRTAKMVDALLLSAKTDLDPDSRSSTVAQAIELLKGSTAPGSVVSKPTEAHIAALRKDPSKAADFDAKFGAGSSKQYLPAQNK